MTDVMSYGGGVQTVAMVVLVARGVLPPPDHFIFADTGREVASTIAYADEHVRPLLAGLGVELEVAPHSLATVDLYAQNGDLLLPVFTETGKLSTYCSTEWKQRPIERYLRARGVSSATFWLGFSLDERHRARNRGRAPWKRTFPLLDLALTRSDCERLIADAGLPVPPKSRCWMCPHQSNAEWRSLTADERARAVALDDEVRDADERGGVYLHQTRIRLADVDLDESDRKVPEGAQCGFGGCWL